MNHDQPSPIAIYSLSSDTRHRVNWQLINDTLGMLAGTRRGTTADQPLALSAADRKRLRQAFELVRNEFATTLAGLKIMTRLILAGIVIALAVAIGGGALMQISPWASIIPIASVGTLAGLLAKMYQLARDQVLLELVPARYELAMEFCRTQADAQDLMAKFLLETTSLSGKATCHFPKLTSVIGVEISRFPLP